VRSDYNARLRIEGGRVSSTDARDHGQFHLRVHDDASGFIVLDAYLEPHQILALLAGGSQTVDGWLNLNEDRRLTKKVVTRRDQVPRDVAWGKNDEDLALDWANDFARGFPEGAREAWEEAAWEEVEVRLTNAGWEAIFRRYE
jgi:hypothetical protein